MTSKKYDTANVPTGFTYFLPAVMVKLDATQGRLTPADVAKLAIASAKTAGAAATAKASADKAKADRDTKKALFDKAKGQADFDPDALKALEKDFASANVAYFKAKAAADYAQDLSARTAGNLTLAQQLAQQKENICHTTATLTKLPIEADTSKHFVAKLKHGWLRSDELTVHVNDLGLLESVDLASVDETAVAAAAAADVFLQAQTFGASGVIPEAGALDMTLAFKPEARAGEEDVDKCPPLVAEAVFDPSVPTGTAPSGAKSIAQVNALMNGLNVILEVTPVGLASGTQPTEAEGYYYRRSIPYQFTLKIGNPPDRVQSARLSLPTAGPIAVADMTAGPFVTTARNMKFVNGMLISNHENRPSEVVGAIKIPAGILKSLLSAE